MKLTPKQLEVESMSLAETEPDFIQSPEAWLDWWGRHYNPENCPLRRAEGEVLLKQRQWLFARC